MRLPRALLLFLAGAVIAAGCGADATIGSENGPASTTGTAFGNADTSASDDEDVDEPASDAVPDNPRLDDDSVISDSERPYAEALGAEIRAGVESVSDSEAVCVGAAFVQAIGLDRIRASDIEPADAGERFEELWSPDEVDVASLVEELEGCGVIAKLAASFAPALARGEMNPADLVCVAGQLDLEEARSIHRLMLSGGDLSEPEGVTQAVILERAMVDCDVELSVDG